MLGRVGLYEMFIRYVQLSILESVAVQIDHSLHITLNLFHLNVCFTTYFVNCIFMIIFLSQNLQTGKSSIRLPLEGQLLLSSQIACTINVPNNNADYELTKDL